MFKRISQKGVSLVSALLLMVVISMAIALIGYLTISSIQVGGTLKTYKTTREAAESSVYTILGLIDNGTAVGNLTSCTSPLPAELCGALERSNMTLSVTVTKIDDLYIVNATVESQTLKTKTHIYVVYKK